MARKFTIQEKVLIKTSLMEKGRELFSKYGLKRTGIEDLTKAAGISQGSFYAFCDSKEELYFEILEMEEKKLTETILNLFTSERLTRTSFKKHMYKYFELLQSNPFIVNLIDQNEYELLLRKLPEEKIKEHLENELWLFKNTIASLQEDGSLKKVRPEVLSGLFYALFLLHLHKKDIGVAVFPEIMALLTDVISEGLISNE